MTFTMHCANIWHKIKEETVHVWNRTEQIDIRICSQISISDNQVCNCVHPTIMLFLDYRITSKQRFVFFFGIPGPMDEDKTCKQSSAPISSFPSCHIKFSWIVTKSAQTLPALDEPIGLRFLWDSMYIMFFATPLHLPLHRNRADRD